MLFGPVLLVVVIGVIVWLVSRARGAQPPRTRSRLEDDLARWVALGLLTEEQAGAIVAHEAGESPRPSVARRPLPPTRPPVAAGLVRRRGLPPIAEALGYLGGMLGIVGLVLLVSRFWEDMAMTGRLALSGGGAGALVAAGALIHAELDPAFERLRAFVWLASSAATGLFAGVIAADGFEVSRMAVAAACGGAVAVESGVLWGWRDRPVQQAVALAAAASFVGATTGSLVGPTSGGVATWVLGAGLVASGLRRHTPSPVLTLAVGAIASVIGTVTAAVNWQGFGLPFGVVTALALLALAVVPGLAGDTIEQLTLGTIGSIALLESTPSALGYFSHEAGIATGLVTWSVGAAILFAGSQRLVRVPVVAQAVGGAAVIGGGALTGAQSITFAVLFGLATAVALVGLGIMPRHVLLSVFGSAGLLVNVPWAVGHFFPGEGRAPLLIMVSGLVILAVAVLLSRMLGRMRHELGPPKGGTPPAAVVR